MKLVETHAHLYSEQFRADRAEVLRRRLAQLSDDDQALLSAALPAIERLVASDAGTTAASRTTSRQPRT